MTSISSLEKRLTELRLTNDFVLPKIDRSASVKNAKSQLEIPQKYLRLMRSIPKDSFSHSDAPRLKTCIEEHLSDLNGSSIVKDSPVIDGLDLNAYPLKVKKTACNLQALHLELPLFPSLPLKTKKATETLYNNSSSVEIRAHLEKLLAMLPHLNEGITLYVKTPIDLVIENEKSLLVKHPLHLPRKTHFFVTQRMLNTSYNVTKILGQGSFGSVSLIASSSNQFAMKTALCYLVGSKKNLENEFLKNEALLYMQLNHPNIVHLEALTDLKSENVALVLEYIKGTALSDFSKNPISYYQVLVILSQIASAMSYLHDAGYIHRDLKDGNILIETTSLKAQLFDFGLTKASESPQDSAGSYYSMAPELSQKSTIRSKKIDVWSFGVLIFTLLTAGQHPYKKTSKDETRESFLHRISELTFKKRCDEKLIFGHLTSEECSLIKKRDPKNILKTLLVKCLHGNQALRPSMAEIESILKTNIESYSTTMEASKCTIL